MTQPAALYARVSSDRQKENHTIDSQTAALIQFAQTHGYQVPPQWQFQDEGYSGATLARPALEALRDLAHQGSIRAVLVYSPDRLSRSYAYQVILAEEFTRAGVELVFLQAPPADTPEQRLLLQFQGMMAEYERAQIAERCRRGKRHRAQQGSVSVLCRAPYGYHYLPKNETSAAAYQVVESEAQVVRWIFAAYTQEGLSMTALARWLNQHHVPTRTGAPWISSTLWGMLRNPAYQGKAYFGKTKAGPPQPRATRRVRLRGPAARRYPSSPQRPRTEWIEIAVPPLVSPPTFALAQEQMEKNRRYSSRRTTVPTLLQSLLVCQHCGYALYRAWSQNTQGRKTYYYRCPGTDAHRRAQGTVCHNRPLRQDALDQRVWEEVVRLLQDPTLMQTEIQRRQDEASKADPHRQRQEPGERSASPLAQPDHPAVRRLSGGLDPLGRVSSPHGGTAAATTSSAGGVTIAAHGGSGPVPVSAFGGNSERVSHPFVPPIRDLGCAATPENRPAVGQRSSGGER
jgi:site-specific DNA recombinase